MPVSECVAWLSLLRQFDEAAHEGVGVTGSADLTAAAVAIAGGPVAHASYCLGTGRAELKADLVPAKYLAGARSERPPSHAV